MTRLTKNQLDEINRILAEVRPITGGLEELNVAEVVVTDNDGGVVARLHNMGDGWEVEVS